MRRIYQLVSVVALAATIVPSAIFLAGHVGLDQVKLVMLLGTVAWFAATPLWMERKQEA